MVVFLHVVELYMLDSPAARDTAIDRRQPQPYYGGKFVRPPAKEGRMDRIAAFSLGRPGG